MDPDMDPKLMYEVFWEVNTSLVAQVEAWSRKYLDGDIEKKKMMQDLHAQSHRVVQLEMDLDEQKQRVSLLTKERDTSKAALSAQIKNLEKELSSVWQHFMANKARLDAATLEAAAANRRYERLAGSTGTANSPSASVPAGLSSTSGFLSVGVPLPTASGSASQRYGTGVTAVASPLSSTAYTSSSSMLPSVKGGLRSAGDADASVSNTNAASKPRVTFSLFK
jgi:septal ring factor EnvC (AmiA/AmiB activator)